MTMIKVMLADDHVLVREGIKIGRASCRERV